MSKSTIKHYTSDAATVTWNRSLCIHIGECGRARGELFEVGRDPWCDPTTADDAHVQDVVERCPTGALSVTFTDHDRAEQPTATNTITVVYNGPLYLRGQLDIEDAPDDAPGLRFRAALCRCGLSASKPWCDNSHEREGFRDYGAVGDTSTSDEPDGGVLNVKVVPHGPLMVSGHVSIIAATGRADWHGDKTALCRCGLSSNKPFCDGSHKREGWQDGR